MHVFVARCVGDGVSLRIRRALLVVVAAAAVAFAAAAAAGEMWFGVCVWHLGRATYAGFG